MWFSTRWRGTSGPRRALRLRWTAAALALLVTGAALALPPVPVRAALPQAVLAGSGRFTWLGLTIYEARLYASPAFDPRRWSEAPFALELTYARTLSGSRIAATSRDELERLGHGDEARRAAWLAEMQRLFPDVEAGSRLTGVHLPGQGARFYAGERLLGSIDDPQFARGFFAIWLDERTRAPALRASLLERAGPDPAAAPGAAVPGDRS